MLQLISSSKQIGPNFSNKEEIVQFFNNHCTFLACDCMVDDIEMDFKELVERLVEAGFERRTVQVIIDHPLDWEDKYGNDILEMNILTINTKVHFKELELSEQTRLSDLYGNINKENIRGLVGTYHTTDGEQQVKTDMYVNHEGWTTTIGIANRLGLTQLVF